MYRSYDSSSDQGMSVYLLLHTLRVYYYVYSNWYSTPTIIVQLYVIARTKVLLSTVDEVDEHCSDLELNPMAKCNLLRYIVLQYGSTPSSEYLCSRTTVLRSALEVTTWNIFRRLFLFANTCSYLQLSL